jgi:hypothetical protein
MRQCTICTLEIRDEADIIRGLTRGELEARILDTQRAQATAPPDVSRQLRLTAQAEADTWQQAADAARDDRIQATNAQALALASQLVTKRQQLETAITRYEQWSAATTGIRETAARPERNWSVMDSPSGQPSSPGPEANRRFGPSLCRRPCLPPSASPKAIQPGWTDAARMVRSAQAAPEPIRQPEVPHQAEIEM